MAALGSANALGGVFRLPARGRDCYTFLHRERLRKRAWLPHQSRFVDQLVHGLKPFLP